MPKKSLLAAVIAALGVTNTHAFGIGDLLSVGIQAGGEIVRAAGGEAVDAIKDAMRDPEEEARKEAEKQRKLAEQMQKQIDEIEAMPNLRPLDRERLVLQLERTWQASQEMQAFVAQAEAQQKAQRAQTLTMGGMAGVVGQAAINSPSMVMAQADLMVANPVWRAEQRLHNEAAFRQADAMVAAGIPQAETQIVLAQAEALGGTELNEVGAGAMIGSAEELAKIKQATGDAALLSASAGQVDTSSLGGETPTTPALVDAVAHPEDPIATPETVKDQIRDVFNPDLGKKVWIEFEDAPAETVALHKLLQERGHTVAQSRMEADVVYLIQGEFVIPETKMHKGLSKSAGLVLESLEESIKPPAGKAMGAIEGGVSRFMLAAAGAQASAAQTEGYRQEVLLVIARQPRDGKETRVSVVRETQGDSLEAAKLVQDAREELYLTLGMDAMNHRVAAEQSE